MTKVSDLADTMERIAPLAEAETWDNVGLLVGDPAQEIRGVMLCIDYTRAVAREARDADCNTVVAYHPPIFDPIKRLAADSLIFDAIQRGVALYSPHTALDVADGGTNDMLADAVGLTERRPLRLNPSTTTQHKLITFVPHEAADRVAAALFQAAAGQLGNYSQCSFRSDGTGTFLGHSGAHPAIGQVGRLETVHEVRLEMMVAGNRLGQVVSALRQAHPYEEPAFDLIALTAPPRNIGLGRIGSMPAVSRQEVLERIKRALGTQQLLVAGPTQGEIRSAAVCAGACGKMLTDAMAQHAELYLTGEMRHHDALRAAQNGMTVVCALHSVSERAVLRRVADRLQHDWPQLRVRLSQSDRDPFEIM